MVFASAVCVSATPTTLAVLVTALWIRPHAWPSTGKSAMAAASVSVVPASVQTQSFRGQPVRCVRPALASVQSISECSCLPKLADIYRLLTYQHSADIRVYCKESISHTEAHSES